MPTTSNNLNLKCVGECLHRSQTSEIYYAIIKRSGKQIKRSLKTTDQALAKRRLSELTEKAAFLSHSENAGKNLSKAFGSVPARSLTKSKIEHWATARSKQISNINL